MDHLVYTNQKTKELSKMIAKEKTMIIRAAAGRKIPHSRVFEGEILYFMEKGSKLITHQAVVDKVYNYSKLTESEILDVFNTHKNALALTKEEVTRWSKRCMILVQFKDLKAISPKSFVHQKNMDDWLILENIDDVILGSSKPYNYEHSKLK
jgi:hypothetical protein